MIFGPDRGQFHAEQAGRGRFPTREFHCHPVGGIIYNMLKGIDPVIGPDLLHVLAAMGHSDEIAIVDANFPAAAMARRLVRMDGVNSSCAMASILKLLPIDDFADCPVAVIQ